MEHQSQRDGADLMKHAEMPAPVSITIVVRESEVKSISAQEQKWVSVFAGTGKDKGRSRC
jgi:hypothetical protein